MGEDLKRAAAAAALQEVQSGMRVGLGSGSTAREFVDLVGARVREGLSIIAVPTSEATAAQARGLGIPLTTLDDIPELDVTIDGADEIGPGLALIKGGGGALGLSQDLSGYAPAARLWRDVHALQLGGVVREREGLHGEAADRPAH